MLVTGFPPFAGVPVNPSQMVVDAIQLGLLTIEGVDLRTELLPVEYAGVEQAFDQSLENFQPQTVVSFGVGRHSSTLRCERVAVNLDDAQIPDNAGEVRQAQQIIANGPETLTSLHDLEMLVSRLHDCSIPAEISENAGRFVCNHLAYYGSYRQRQIEKPFDFLFIHVPTFQNGFELEQTLEGIEVIIETFRPRVNAR